MTSSNEQLVPVEQIDREAGKDFAANLFNLSTPMTEHEKSLYLVGEYDHSGVVQAFARHRLAALRTPPVQHPGWTERGKQWLADGAPVGDAFAQQQESGEGVLSAVKETLRGDYTDPGMRDAFFRWPVIEQAIRDAMQPAQPVVPDALRTPPASPGHFSRQHIVKTIINAMVEAKGDVKAVPAGKAADDILAYLEPYLRTPPAVEPDEGLVEAVAMAIAGAIAKRHGDKQNAEDWLHDSRREEARAVIAILPSIRAQALEEAEAVFKEEKNAQAERLGLVPDKMESPVRYYERVRRTAIRALRETQL